MTAEMVIAFIIGMWLGIGLLKLSELIANVYRKRELKKMMESLLEDLEKAHKELKEMQEEQKENEKVKKPRAKKTQK